MNTVIYLQMEVVFILNALHTVLYALTTDNCTVDHHIRCNLMTREGRGSFVPSNVGHSCYQNWMGLLLIYFQPIL